MLPCKEGENGDRSCQETAVDWDGRGMYAPPRGLGYGWVSNGGFELVYWGVEGDGEG